MAIPAELITGGISAILSFIGSVVSMKIKARAEEQRMLIERATLQQQITESARQFNTKGSRFTRRFIAITATFSVLVFPMLAPLYGLDVVTGWTEMTSGFWPFVDPKTQMVWHSVTGGVVITPLHTHILSVIIGFYFGHSVAENARTR